MINLSAIIQFKEQSTWRLLGLGLITYGLYFAYYVKRQTAKLNSLSQPESQISYTLVNLILSTSYVCVGLFLISLFADEVKLIEIVLKVMDLINTILILTWGLKAKNRINSIFQFELNDKKRFSRIWSFLFSPMYFNYKINSIYDEGLEKATSV